MLLSLFMSHHASTCCHRDYRNDLSSASKPFLHHGFVGFSNILSNLPSSVLTQCMWTRDTAISWVFHKVFLRETGVFCSSQTASFSLKHMCSKSRTTRTVWASCIDLFDEGHSLYWVHRTIYAHILVEHCLGWRTPMARCVIFNNHTGYIADMHHLNLVIRTFPEAPAWE